MELQDYNKAAILNIADFVIELGQGDTDTKELNDNSIDYF